MFEEEFFHLVNDFLKLEDLKNPKDINQGLCADFADYVLRKTSFEIEIKGIYDYEDTIEYTNKKSILKLAKEDIFGHTFVKYKEKYYDSESVNGVYNPFKLPIFKRAINESKKNKINTFI